jgi:hypothetical protein
VALASTAALVGVGADAALSQPVSAGAAQQPALSLVRGITAISPLGLAPGAATGGPASLVDPFDGTGIGPTNPGNVSEYPGASVPLGMVQFSPDTSPDRGHDRFGVRLRRHGHLGIQPDPPLGGRLRHLRGHPHPALSSVPFPPVPTLRSNPSLTPTSGPVPATTP